MGRRKTRGMKKQMHLKEVEEINLLNEWIESQKPDSGSNPLSFGSLPKNSKIGLLENGVNGPVFSRYAGARWFEQLPISDKTKRGLKGAEYVDMTDVQRAALPHALCGRDILGAARTGSGKTLAFVIPILEKLHRERFIPEVGVGCIIISPTRELAEQTFNVLNKVGKFHNFSVGLLTGGHEGVDVEKDQVNMMNILVCVPGRLLQHMDETPNFECSNLQILILDEADRVLDSAFKGQLDPIISQLPKKRQTLLFSATQTKKVDDLARLSLKDPEYISVHEESVSATPTRLKQTVMIVPVEKKLDMLWAFIKYHLNSRILVFLSTRKQVTYVHDAFNKLRPGIPLKSLHGKMSQDKRRGVCSQFIESQRSVLFCTDVLARGLDFDKAVDWVVQVDCPEDVASYIHRVGRTARFNKSGKSLLFLTPSEKIMVKRLREARVPVKVMNAKDDIEVSRHLASLLVQYPDLQAVAQRAFITYLRSLYKRRDKEMFDMNEESVEKFAASLGLPMTPKIRFRKLKTKKKGVFHSSIALEEPENYQDNEAPPTVVKKVDLLGEDLEEEDFALKPREGSKEEEKSSKNKEVPMAGTREKRLKINLHRPSGSRVVFDEEGNSLAPLARVAARTEGNSFALKPHKGSKEEEKSSESKEVPMPGGTRVLKKKLLKINLHRPSGSRVVFDEEGNSQAPLARVAATTDTEIALFDKEKRNEFYKKLGEQLRKADHEDKKVERERRREKRMKEKSKRKRGAMEEEGSPEEEETGKRAKKIFFGNEDNGDEEGKEDTISIAELEEMALKFITQS